MKLSACVAALLVINGPANAQVIKGLSGQWAGMAHFSARVSQNGRSLEDPSAKAHVELYIDIDKQGNISGRTTSNNCQIRGLATPWALDNVLDLQVNFSGCHHAGFNRRFTGQLVYRPHKRNADITLSTLDVSMSPSRIATYSVHGNIGL